ncbi:hypothetical protein [Microbulbifer sp.]|uniref:hypothetical protein n=1 Tax=Microbulbifer sp. TaxID=1908541 RepID=UPI002590B437|nr:hypothetical protein [Microbulbifer sp.]
MIRSLSLIFFLFLSFSSIASPPIEEVEVTSSLAKKLGFKVKVQPEGNAVVVEVSGPSEIKSGCLPSRSGNFVLGKNGEEVAVYIAELPRTSESPKAIGYIVSGSPNSMGVFIDYFCPKKRAHESKRYVISSVRAWGS